MRRALAAAGLTIMLAGVPAVASASDNGSASGATTTLVSPTPTTVVVTKIDNDDDDDSDKTGLWGLLGLLGLAGLAGLKRNKDTGGTSSRRHRSQPAPDGAWSVVQQPVTSRRLRACQRPALRGGPLHVRETE